MASVCPRISVAYFPGFLEVSLVAQLYTTVTCLHSVTEIRSKVTVFLVTVIVIRRIRHSEAVPLRLFCCLGRQ